MPAGRGDAALHRPGQPDPPPGCGGGPTRAPRAAATRRARQRHPGQRMPLLRPVRTQRQPADRKLRAAAGPGHLGPVAGRAVREGLQRHLGQAVPPGDGLAVDVPGEQAPDPVPGEQAEQRRLVVDVVVPAAHREVLEHDHRGARVQPAEITVEPVQALAPAMAGLQQRLGRIEPDKMDTGRVERIGRHAEVCLVKALSCEVPPHVMIAWHVSDPAAQRGRDRLLVQVVFAGQPGVGDVAAMQHEVRAQPGQRGVRPPQLLRRRGPRRADMRIAEHREPQRLVSRDLHRGIICAPETVQAWSRSRRP